MSEEDEFDFDRLRPRLEEVRRLQTAATTRFSELHALRAKYFKTRASTDRAELERIESEVQSGWNRSVRLLEEIKSELPPEIARQLGQEAQWQEGSENKVSRNDLVESNVAITGNFDDYLPKALDDLIKLMPNGWLDQEDPAPTRIGNLFNGTECLSLIKGMRPESELNPVHRLRQALLVASDYMNNEPNYDHFGGALLVPQTAYLGSKLDALNQVGGEVTERISMLWRGASASCDSTIYELLVAAGCVEYGRNVEFLPATDLKSPDIRCHDPYPMVIECKRKRSLSNYEIKEGETMRALFLELETAARRLGLCGRFDLSLNIDAASMPRQEIIDRLTMQRLTPQPDRPLAYPWGMIAFHELPRRFSLSRRTRNYGANMLREVFDWNTDLPEWDGIVCRVDGGAMVDIEEVQRPVGLVWSNLSDSAVKKRSWGPVDLLGSAMAQIPHGEFGVIYIAYHEGARADIADKRVQELTERVHEWEHTTNIRVPIAFLTRLYPRPLGGGIPDLIESTIRFCSGVYGQPALFGLFPNSVFTRT
jgi:hypothetical protein